MTRYFNRICIVTRTVFGHSGNELMPPIVEQIEYCYNSAFDETSAAFQQRMADTVLPMRRAAEKAKPKPYSICDGWDWSIINIEPNPMPDIETLYGETRDGG